MVNTKARLVMDVRTFKSTSRVGWMAYLATTDYRLRCADQPTFTKEIKVGV